MRVDESELHLHIGRLLRKKREALGLSQQAVGEKVGLGRASICQIETGEQKAPLRVLYDLCVVLELEPVDILPTIAEMTTDQERVSVMISGKLTKVTHRTAKYLQKIATLDKAR